MVFNCTENIVLLIRNVTVKNAKNEIDRQF